MKILPLSLLGLSYANNIYKCKQFLPVVVDFNLTMLVFLVCDIHRETVSVGRQATTIASPDFPDSFSVQTQCKWM